jgi:biotin operon repressor
MDKDHTMTTAAEFSPRRKQLEIARRLAAHDTSSEQLQFLFDVSRATLNRYLAELREMGAEIGAYQAGRAWMYRLENWPVIRARVLRWLQLETERSLLP